MPAWLVRGLGNRSIRFSGLGGLSLHDTDGVLESSSLPGDYLVRVAETGDLSFWNAATFKDAHIIR